MLRKSRKLWNKERGTLTLNLNIDGMEIYLNIKGYQKTNSENCDDTWCSVDFEFKFTGCIDYSMNDAEILLACEVEGLESILTELLEDKLQQEKNEYSFIEPDFEFRLYPKHKITDEDPDVIYIKPGHELMDVSADWIINLWHEGALTANSFSVAMDREDITQLRDYLRSILEA